MVSDYWSNMLTIGAYVLVVLVTCMTTATIALFCSVLFHKSSVSLMTAYMFIMILFAAPLGAKRFADTFFSSNQAVMQVTNQLGFISPVSMSFNLPLDIDRSEVEPIVGSWKMFFYFLGSYAALNCVLLGLMGWLFRSRWRVAH